MNFLMKKSSPSTSVTLKSDSVSNQETRAYYTHVDLTCFSSETCKVYNSKADTTEKSSVKHVEQIRLKLTDKYLILQKELKETQICDNNEESSSKIDSNDIFKLTKSLNSNLEMSEIEKLKYSTHTFQHLQFANSIINYENNEEIRNVKLKRHPLFGLGLCVKGGKEHGLPLLISNMFKNQPGMKINVLFFHPFLWDFMESYFDTFKIPQFRC